MPADSRRVFAVGYYGMGNLGDDLFADVVRRVPLWGDAQVATVVPSRLGPWSRLDRVGQGLRTAASLAGWAWSDTIAECGGSVWGQLSGTTKLRDRLPGRRREALGVSVGPFVDETAERDVRRHLARLDRLVVRDDASCARAGQEYPVGGDLAALHPDVRASDEHSELVTVCPSAAAAAPVADVARELAAALVAVGRPPVRVLALNCHPTLGDVTRAAELRGLLRRRGLHAITQSYAQLGRRGTLTALASSRAVWSERLHGAVVAYLSGVPTALVGQHAKCGDFAADVGLPPECLVAVGAPWQDAAFATLAGAAAAVGPDAYRARARRVYLGEAR